MQPQDPRPGQDPPTEEHATGAWQQPPAQPSLGQPQQPPQPQWQQPPAQPSLGQPQQPPQPQWQQPPAQPSWGQPQQPPQPQWPGQVPPQGASQQPAQQGWQQPPAQPSWGQPAASGWGDARAQFVGGRSAAVTVAGIVLLLFSLLPAFVGGIMLLAGSSSDLVDQIAAQLGNSGVEVTRQAIRDIIVVLGAILGGFGLFGLIGGLGMVLRRTWGRVFGFLVACLGTLFGLLLLIGSVGGRGAAATSSQGSLIVAVVIFAGYAFVLIMTLIGSKHFRRG